MSLLFDLPKRRHTGMLVGLRFGRSKCRADTFVHVGLTLKASFCVITTAIKMKAKAKNLVTHNKAVTYGNHGVAFGH